MRKTLVISLLLTFLAACSPSTSIPSTTMLPPTQTKALRFTPTDTPAPIVSVTLSASETASPIPDPASQILFSPDGKYVAKRYDPSGRPSLEKDVIEIFDEQNRLLWQIPYQGERSTGDPGTSLVIYGW